MIWNIKGCMTAKVHEGREFGKYLSSKSQKVAADEFLSSFKWPYLDSKAENNNEAINRSSVRIVLSRVPFFCEGLVACSGELIY